MLFRSEWREVVEQQVYVLEEIANTSESLQNFGPSHKNSQQAQQDFNNALADFQFCMKKATEALVSRDTDNQTESTRRSLGETGEAAYKEQLQKTLKQQATAAGHVVVKPSRFGRELLAAIEQGTGGSTSASPSLYDIKLFANKVLKKLREDLAIAQSNYIKRMNADVIEFELGHSSSQLAQQRSTDVATLQQELKLLRQEILSLRLSDTFLRKLCHQITAISECLPLCHLENFLGDFIDKIYAGERRANAQTAQSKK